jgi:hypothetical protein
LPDSAASRAASALSPATARSSAKPPIDVVLIVRFAV